MRNPIFAYLGIGAILFIAIGFLLFVGLPSFGDTPKPEPVATSTPVTAPVPPTLAAYSTRGDASSSLSFQYPENYQLSTSTDAAAIITDRQYPDLLKAWVYSYGDFAAYRRVGPAGETFSYNSSTDSWQYLAAAGGTTPPDPLFSKTTSGENVYKITFSDAGNFSTSYIIPQKSKDRVVVVSYGWSQANESIMTQTEAFGTNIEAIAETVQ